MTDAIVVGKKVTAGMLRRLAKSAQDAERERKMLVLADRFEDEEQQTELAEEPKRD
jgi:hypothetical protein